MICDLWFDYCWSCHAWGFTKCVCLSILEKNAAIFLLNDIKVSLNSNVFEARKDATFLQVISEMTHYLIKQIFEENHGYFESLVVSDIFLRNFMQKS